MQGHRPRGWGQQKASSGQGHWAHQQYPMHLMHQQHQQLRQPVHPLQREQYWAGSQRHHESLCAPCAPPNVRPDASGRAWGGVGHHQHQLY